MENCWGAGRGWRGDVRTWVPGRGGGGFPWDSGHSTRSPGGKCLAVLMSIGVSFCPSRKARCRGVQVQALLCVVRHQLEAPVLGFRGRRKGHPPCFLSRGEMKWVGGYPLRMHLLQGGWRVLDFLGPPQVNTCFPEKLLVSASTFKMYLSLNNKS